jgi:hypothetical protein
VIVIFWIFVFRVLVFSRADRFRSKDKEAAVLDPSNAPTFSVP